MNAFIAVLFGLSPISFFGVVMNVLYIEVGLTFVVTIVRDHSAISSTEQAVN
jgi:hypothetical protein